MMCAYGFKLMFASEMVYTITLVGVKISILLFYRSIFTGRAFAIVVNVTSAFAIALGFASILVSIFTCRPIYGSWDITVPSTCISIYPRVLPWQRDTEYMHGRLHLVDSILTSSQEGLAIANPLGTLLLMVALVTWLNERRGMSFIVCLRYLKDTMSLRGQHEFILGEGRADARFPATTIYNEPESKSLLALMQVVQQPELRVPRRPPRRSDCLSASCQTQNRCQQIIIAV